MGELVAYITVRPGAVLPSVGELRDYLSAELPDYMLPAYFVPLEKLPLNSSGKIDRRLLPAPEAGILGAGVGYEVPRTLTEQSLADLWMEVLGREQIGIHDNFFHLGGHSLRAIRLLSLIRETLGAEISLKDIFAQPTIAGQAGLIAVSTQSASEQIPLAEPAADYALSNAQRRLWVLSDGTRCLRPPNVFMELSRTPTSVTLTARTSARSCMASPSAAPLQRGTLYASATTA